MGGILAVSNIPHVSKPWKRIDQMQQKSTMPITVTCFPGIPSVEKAFLKASVPPIVYCPLCHQYRRNGSQWIRPRSFLGYFLDSYMEPRRSYSGTVFSDGGIRSSYSKELIRVNCESIIRTEFCRVSYAPAGECPN